MVLIGKPSLVLLAIVAATGAGTCYADIVANFGAGDSSTVVDGNPGIAGDGWSSAWQSYATRTAGSTAKATVTASVQSGNPLAPGSGSYLSVNVSTDATANVVTLSQGDIGRSWISGAGGIDTSGTTRIEFYFRPQTVDANTRYVIFDSVAGASGTDGNCTFQIAANASGWVFYDGQGKNVTTRTFTNGKALAQGHTYHLAIDVTSEGQWRGSVTDLNAPANGTFSTDWIGFRSSSKLLNRNLFFGAADQTPGTANNFSFDIDGIKITPVPEVASLSMLGMAGALMLARRNP